MFARDMLVLVIPTREDFRNIPFAACKVKSIRTRICIVHFKRSVQNIPFVHQVLRIRQEMQLVSIFALAEYSTTNCFPSQL